MFNQNKFFEQGGLLLNKRRENEMGRSRVTVSYKPGWSEGQIALLEKLAKAIESSHEPVKGWEMTLSANFIYGDYVVAVLVESVQSWIALDPDGQQRVLRFAVASKDGWALSRPWRPQWRGWDYIPSGTKEGGTTIQLVIAWYPKVRRETFSVGKKRFRPFV